MAAAFEQALKAATNSTAAVNDHLRTVASVLKPQKPSPYDGKTDALASLNFIESQQEYFEIVDLNKNEWVKYVVLSLNGDAKAWWRDSGLTKETPWDEFRKAFLLNFTPPDSANAARQELSQLRQKGMSVAEYTTKFRRLMRLIPNLDEASALFAYLGGLESSTSKEVRLRQPTSLNEAVSQATIVHSILHPTAPTALTIAPAQSARAPEPMDIDAMQMLLANLNTLINNSTSVNAFQQPQQPINKLSPQERAYLIRIGGCFRCRKPGHRSSECRAHTTNATFTAPRKRLNNFETKSEETQEQGKEKGEL